MGFSLLDTYPGKQVAQLLGLPQHKPFSPLCFSWHESLTDGLILSEVSPEIRSIEIFITNIVQLSIARIKRQFDEYASLGGRQELPSSAGSGSFIPVRSLEVVNP